MCHAFFGKSSFLETVCYTVECFHEWVLVQKLSVMNETGQKWDFLTSQNKEN